MVCDPFPPFILGFGILLDQMTSLTRRDHDADQIRQHVEEMMSSSILEKSGTSLRAFCECKPNVVGWVAVGVVSGALSFGKSPPLLKPTSPTCNTQIGPGITVWHRMHVCDAILAIESEPVAGWIREEGRRSLVFKPKPRTSASRADTNNCQHCPANPNFLASNGGVFQRLLPEPQQRRRPLLYGPVDQG